MIGNTFSRDDEFPVQHYPQYDLRATHGSILLRRVHDHAANRTRGRRCLACEPDQECNNKR